ncbi:MAG: acyltransferase family protein [Clostridia bacterium]|nr:acyltransferase family protein [Clostridia bacterium]
MALKIGHRKKSLHNRITLLALFVILYVIIVGMVKETRFVNTVLCYVAGFYYSCFKDEIEGFIQRSNLNYATTLMLVCFCFIVIFIADKLLGSILKNNFIYNLYSIFFVGMILLASMKFKLNNKIFTFFGQHVFWIYILQRIPMIILQGRMNNYMYFVLSFAITILLAFLMKKFTDKLWSKEHISNILINQ